MGILRCSTDEWERLNATVAESPGREEVNVVRGAGPASGSCDPACISGRRADDVRVDIWSDIVCPWCYIGHSRFSRALAGFEHRDEVEVVYRSFDARTSLRAVRCSSRAT
jgi:DSBA-like thioredoxin domain